MGKDNRKSIITWMHSLITSIVFKLRSFSSFFIEKLHSICFLSPSFTSTIEFAKQIVSLLLNRGFNNNLILLFWQYLQLYTNNTNSTNSQYYNDKQIILNKYVYQYVCVYCFVEHNEWIAQKIDLQEAIRICIYVMLKNYTKCFSFS